MSAINDEPLAKGLCGGYYYFVYADQEYERVNEPTAVDMRKITKSFPGVIADRQVDFTARWGEIHALIGENGAGKSTLMKVLYGSYLPDSGEIRVSDVSVSIKSPGDAIRLGIGMVHQRFMLIPAFTALENVILGSEPVRKGRIDYSAAENTVKEICGRLDLDINLNAKVSSLSVSSQQKVEILKALYRKARILILDEPTSILAPRETENLFLMLRRMASEGMCIILISHKLSDVMAYTDRVTILRQGMSVASMNTGSTNPEEMARLMVGQDAGVIPAARHNPEGSRRSVLMVRGLCADGDSGRTAVDGVDFDLCGGEIVGVAGVDGNGQRELAEAIFGLRRASGSVSFVGRELTGMPVKDRISLGMAYIPEDTDNAVIPDFNIDENAILGSQSDSRFTRFGIINRRSIESYAAGIISEYKVKSTGTDMPVRMLSGGNQQKLILGRALESRPKLLVASQPTRGLDVNAAGEIHRRLTEQASGGSTVLLISYDLDEILSLSDRIMVMYKGRIVRILDRNEADREIIGALMLGAAV